MDNKRINYWTEILGYNSNIEYDEVRAYIKQIINETKEEDSRLAWKAMGHDAAEAILASKLKE